MFRNDWYFFDYETFTANVKGAVSQFAGIRTDSNFSSLETTNIFCKVADDTLIEPEACFVTGIAPEDTLGGLPEYEFAHRINNLFLAKKNTYIVGYNNTSFDDEVSRNLFYRNGIDPYGWAWRGYNKRVDILPLVRMVAALRPDVLVFPEVDDVDEDGQVVGKKVSLKLEHLSAANGIIHENAHDALSDVEALIAITKLISERAPELFNEYLKNSDKKFVNSFLNDNESFGYSSFKFGRESMYAAPALLLGEIKDGKYLSWDMRVSPEPLLLLSDEDVQKLISMRKEERIEAGLPEKHGLFSLKANGLPSLFDKKHLTSSVRERLCFDVESIQKNKQLLLENKSFVDRVLNIYATREYPPIPNDTDINLYCSVNGGFFAPEEASWISRFEQLGSWSERLTLWMDLDDGSRLKQMFFRVIGRNSPDVFYGSLERAWREYVSARLSGLTANAYTSTSELVEKLNDDDFNKEWVGGDKKAIQIKESLIEFVVERSKVFEVNMDAYDPPSFLASTDEFVCDDSPNEIF